MHLIGPQDQPITNELAVLRECLPLEGARVLELGCGAAATTRLLAERCGVAEIVASEVDQIQHGKNLEIDDLPAVTFKAYGAEAIDEPDARFDIVLMFKSLHHVPGEALAAAMREIHRVLKPGGLAYISEPVFDGPFNEVIRLFHDEEVVRKAAFDAVCEAVRGGVFELREERFFRSRINWESWGQFEGGIINATHTEHNLDDALRARVRDAFERHASDEGYVFEVPIRVDVLLKPAA